MTTTILRLLGIATAADGAWQLLDRKGWARFWARSLVKLRKPSGAALAVAGGELLLGGWIALRGVRARAGKAARFETAPGHHPITAT